MYMYMYMYTHPKNTKQKNAVQTKRGYTYTQYRNTRYIPKI